MKFAKKKSGIILRRNHAEKALIDNQIINLKVYVLMIADGRRDMRTLLQERLLGGIKGEPLASGLLGTIYEICETCPPVSRSGRRVCGLNIVWEGRWKSILPI